MTTGVATRAKDVITEAIAEGCIAVGDAGERSEPVEAHLATLGSAFPQHLEIGPILNVLVRKRPLWGSLFPLRVLTTALADYPHAVTVLDYSFVQFDADYELLPSHVLKKCSTIQKVIFLQCRGLTAERFATILACVNEPQSGVATVHVSGTLYGQLKAQWSPEQLVKLHPVSRGASTAILTTAAVSASSPLSPTNNTVSPEADDQLPAPEGAAPAVPANSHDPSPGDVAWAHQVFRQHKIPLKDLFDPHGKAAMNKFIDSLKAHGGKSKVTADEILQARRFLMRDPSVLNKVEGDKWARKRTRQTGDRDNDDDNDDEAMGGDGPLSDADKYMSLAKAFEVLKKFKISVGLVFNDMTTVDGKITQIAASSSYDAKLVEKAVSVVAREGGAAESYQGPDGRREKRGQSYRRLEGPSITEGAKLDMAWAQQVLHAHNLIPEDAIAKTDALKDQLRVLFQNANTSNQAADLQRAVDIFHRAGDLSATTSAPVHTSSLLASGSSLDESMAKMVAWATATLRSVLGISDVSALMFVRRHELEEDLEQLDSHVAEKARCALEILRANKEQKMPSEAVLIAFNELSEH